MIYLLKHEVALHPRNAVAAKAGLSTFFLPKGQGGAPKKAMDRPSRWAKLGRMCPQERIRR